MPTTPTPDIADLDRRLTALEQSVSLERRVAALEVSLGLAQRVADLEATVTQLLSDPRAFRRALMGQGRPLGRPARASGAPAQGVTPDTQAGGVA